MSAPLAFADGGRGEQAQVVAVELTVDGMLVVADRLGIGDFPTVLGIRPNIADDHVRAAVHDQVERDLTAQGVLDHRGRPHLAVADMIDRLSRPDRWLAGRWWRRDAGDRLLRFALCRAADDHLIAVRDDALIVVQRVAPQLGPVDMLTTVMGRAEPAAVEPLTGLASELAGSRTEPEIARHGVSAASARAYSDMLAHCTGWVEITAGQRHPGGTTTESAVAAGVLDSRRGRIVSLPRRVGGDLYGSLLPGTEANLARALEALLGTVPAGGWSDPIAADS